MRLMIPFALWAIACIAVADSITYEITQAGTKIGQSVYELNKDGTFKSTSKIAVMNVKIDSVLSGKFIDGKLSSFDLTQTSPGVDVVINYAAGKVKAKVNGKDQPSVPMALGKSLFSNYHPGPSSTILENIGSAGPEPKSVKLSMLDNGGTPFDATVVLGTPRTIQVDGKDVVLRMFKLVIATTEINYAVREDGQIVAEVVESQKLRMIATGYDAAFVDPVLKYKELSQPTFPVKIESAVKVPMRDGTVLVHSAAMPNSPGKYPVILSRTPYGRAGSMLGAEWWAQRGYVFIAQDCRGRHGSGGNWDPFSAERQDGKDTIDWIAKQPWSNGKVGMIGGSYGGYVQWAAAVEHPAALKCIVPQVSPPDAMRNIPFDNGIFMLLPNLWWTNIVRDKNSHMERAAQPLPHPEKLATLPLSKVDDAVLGVNVPFFDEWLKREGMAKWKGRFDTLSAMSTVSIPALHISGWWDGDGIGTKLNWATMRAAGRTNQWLIYGPWPHGFNVSTKFGDMDYGPDSVLELDSVYLRWFDTWLKDKDVSFDKTPKVQAFITGRNQWANLTDWPEKGAGLRVFYLGNGGSLTDKPSANATPAKYTYDPSKAVIPQEVKGNMMAAGSTKMDLKTAAKEGLVFKSAPFDKDTALGGPISVDLFFSTNVVSTDFFAMICDIDEKGEARVLSLPGKIDVRYLDGLDAPKLIKPGQSYRAKFDIWDTAHEFKKGHRMGLFITSTMFPGYARNLNTGEPIFSATKMKVAQQVIYRDAKRPSAVRLRVLN